MTVKMRLTQHDADAIRQLLRQADPQGKIYLFGSRADDAKKGGDIDIFFEPARRLDLPARLALEHQLAAACDMKVDLLVKNPDQAENTIFAIAREGVPL